MTYKHIGVIFGGRSGEHEVSLVSGQSVMNALSRDKYNVLPIGITKSGRWVCGDGALQALKSGAGIDALPQCILSPDPGKRMLLIVHRSGRIEEKPIDLVFPVLHGPYGEDGTIQGLFEMAGIPFVGSGVLASAICMNKVVQKRIFTEAGIPQVEYTSIDFGAYTHDPSKYIDKVHMLLDYPVFVKPASLGSSVGITKARNEEELRASIALASQYDSTIVVEQAVIEPREMEVAVLGNREPIASPPGEIIPGNEFYDYNAKYVDGSSQLLVPADVPDSMKDMMQDLAVQAFKSTQCEGLARVDFLYSKRTGELVVNEINTMPGFTSISMYPKLFEAAGIGYSDLLDRLVRLAIQRHTEQQTLKRSYENESKWYEQ